MGQCRAVLAGERQFWSGRISSSPWTSCGGFPRQQGRSDLGRHLSIPLTIAGHVVVPNLTSDCCNTYHEENAKTTDTAWEKQTLMKLVRVVRSSQNNLTTVFSKLAKQDNLLLTRGSCTCHALHSPQQYGNVQLVEGDVPLLPVRSFGTAGTVLRPKDPLVVPGR